MIGIYEDSFIDLLKEYLSPVKITGKNIICQCPYCEVGKEDKSHYHFYIALEAPIFHCFEGDCSQKGTIPKLLKKLNGTDDADKYIDKSKIHIKEEVEEYNTKELIFPEIIEKEHRAKISYLRKRFRYADIDIKRIKGLVLDVKKFIEINNLKVRNKFPNYLNVIDSNYVGFCTEHNSLLILRNIYESDYRYEKISLSETQYLDYYKIPSYNYYSKTFVLGEGIFDIFSEHINDSLGLRSESKLYACALSTGYKALIQSLVYNEQIFRPDIHILSDNGINLSKYHRLKKDIGYLINSLSVYYNRSGKDFGELSLGHDKIMI